MASLSPPPASATTPAFDYEGTGSPEGVVTATVDKTYRDTEAGAIFIKTAGSGNTGWAQVGGRLWHGTAVDGFQAKSGGGSYVLGTFGGAILDLVAWNGSFNGVFLDSTGVDGEQTFKVQLGSSGQFSFTIDADGKTTIPAALNLAAIPTSDPAVAGAVWNNAGTLKISAG